MRKILTASTALLGLATATAFAQTSAPANPSQGQYAGPYGAGPASNNNNNAWGVANTPSGSKAAGPLSTIYAPNVIAVPAPGTIVIRLNGRVEADLTANFTSADKGLHPDGTPNGYKLNPLGVSSYMRLYPGFDGLSANGIRYGASVELRENFGAGNASSIEQPAGTGPATSPSANTSGETVFVRRAFAYLATDQAGLIRIGQADGVLGLFDNCIFTSQCWDAGITGVNGGALQASGPGAVASIPFVWLNQSSPDYGTNKIVYLSPQFYGFDFGVQYVPNQGNAFQDEGSGAGCNQAAPGCITLSSGNDATRWINQVGVGLRYQQAFGPVDFKVYGFYDTAGKENLTTQSYMTPGPSANPQFLRYANLNFYKAGVAVTAYNITAALDYIGGQVNNALNMKPVGGVNMNAEMAGLTYAAGPFTIGANLGIIDSQGAAQLAGLSQRHEYEVAAGGAYKLAPGVQLVAEYMYIHRYQGGWDFNQNAPGLNGTTRSAQGQGAMFSTVLTW